MSEEEEFEEEEEKSEKSDVKITVEPSKEALEDTIIAKKLREEVIKSYSRAGKEVPESLESWEDIDKAIRGLEKKELRSGVPLTEEQLGDEHKFPVDFEDLPLDLVPFESEDEAFRYLKKTADESTDPERKREAEKLLGQLVKQHARKSGTYELEGSLKDAIVKKKTKFKKVNG